MADVVTVDGTAGTCNFKITRGDRIKPTQFDWGSSVDLSDRTWEAQARADLDEGVTVVADFTVDDSDAATGKSVVTLPAAQARLLVTGTTDGNPTPGKGRYYWDLQATSSTDPEDVFTWITGKIDVAGDVTVTP